ncbi:MAG: CHAT domain-containing protein, partial [Solirubrobacteraceae bacterium]
MARASVPAHGRRGAARACDLRLERAPARRPRGAVARSIGRRCARAAGARPRGVLHGARLDARRQRAEELRGARRRISGDAQRGGPRAVPPAVGGHPGRLRRRVSVGLRERAGPLRDSRGRAARGAGAAAEAGGAAFTELGEVDERSLQAALDAGPPSVLHLLCHGLPGPEGEPSRLRWGASDSPSEITGPRLARMLRSHAPSIRLVVLSACGSGDGRGDPLFLTSFAQELHRSGVPGVVASRYPLSARGSTVMTRALYDQMLREAWSLERALRHTRQTLFRVDDAGEAHPGDAYGIQLYGHDTEWFVSDNDIEAERPILASYPFGTPAQPSPSREPPAAELALQLERGASM